LSNLLDCSPVVAHVIHIEIQPCQHSFSAVC
jgi:hypothetical protein